MYFIPLRKTQLLNKKENALYFELYSKEEQQLLLKLEKLFQDWHSTFKQAQNDDGIIIRDFTANDMSFDGFYPGYLDQNPKLLFIGREGRGISGENYLETIFGAIRDNEIGKISLNRHAFHRRMIYLSYALKENNFDYTLIPCADKISNTFGTDKLSYSFMNISKFSKKEGTPNADYELINKSVELSTKDRNFIKEEISLLDPDVIIFMKMPQYFSVLGEVQEIPNCIQSNIVQPYKLKINKKTILLINTYHFSKVISEKTFFNAITDTIRKHTPMNQ